MDIALFLASAAVLVVAAKAPAADRPTISLDGVWQFRFAPDDRGTSERWFDGSNGFDRTIKVPGCWDAQGVGESTDKLRHSAIGVGWYRRIFSIPRDWRGRKVWLVVGGVHRSADFWVNGRHAGEHIGYPTSFRIDITNALIQGKTQALVIAVDSRRTLDEDALTGTFDVIDYMDLTWGGIFEHVSLEATGDTWLDDIFCLPDPTMHSVTVQPSLGGESDRGLTIDYTVLDGRQVYANGTIAIESFQIDLPNAPLWTPDEPHLLTLELTLKREGESLDKRRVRFGLRRLEVRGPDFILNGERFFLRGYGDDFTFPRELLPPADVGYWKKYLQKRKDFGFNGVRHHSMMPTESYLQAADEVGMLVQPELPIAYQPFFDHASPTARELYTRVWTDYIRQMRNHPSVMSWCMGNELWNGFPMGPELYRLAKELDPTRPVIDTDGIGPSIDRLTLDYHMVQFDEGQLPWGTHRGKYEITKPAKPTLVHEMANISVLPSPSDIPKYDGAVKPFWLQEMAAAVRKQGLEKELPAMLAASAHLQASLLKLNIEAARLSPGIDGFHQWLFRDYWTRSSGFVNQLDQSRAISPKQARMFNSSAVLLWDHDRVNFRSGEEISLRVFLSDFRPSKEPPITRVRLRLGDAEVLLEPPTETGGRGLVGPWTGSLRAPILSRPKKLVLRATTEGIINEWPVWIFPPAPATSGGIIVTRWLTKDVLERLRNGASVLLTDDREVFPQIDARFKPAWWKGDENDHSFGNMFSKHPALKEFPTDGYGDLQTFALLDRRPVVVLDQVPGHIEPIVWCLDLPWRMARKAYLFEARVGKGRLVVSTMNLSQDPASQWMFSALTRYVASDACKPKAELPYEWLAERVGRMDLPDRATWIEGFHQLVEATEGESKWLTYREDDAVQYVVRQTDGKQRVRWMATPVPKDWPHKTVTFAWAGGIGYLSQPDRGSFALSVDAETLEIPSSQSPRNGTARTVR